MRRARISERLRISILRWTKPMTVSATRSWHRFTPSGGKRNRRAVVGCPCDLGRESNLNGYRAQSRLQPFPAGRTPRGNLRGAAALLRHSVRSEAIEETPTPGILGVTTG